MASPISGLTPAMLQPLGWALIHFLWQGALVAALAAILMRCCRGAPARYLVGVGALVLMLAMPLATMILFGGGAVSFAPPAGFFAIPPQAHIQIRVAEFWLGGVMLLSLRFAGGVLLLEKRRRTQSCAPSGRVLALCLEVQQRLNITRAIRYLECGWLKVPAVIGCFRPLVLLPVAALTGLSEAQLRAVIAHELAHVRRWDFPVNLFQILAETLLFYHPAIWWLNGRIRAEREMCCDEIAVSEIGNRRDYATVLVDYARALALMEEWKSAPGPALAANHGILSERIFHILGLPAARSRSAGLGVSLMLLAASLAGLLMLPAAAPIRAIPHRVVAASLTPMVAEAPMPVLPAAAAQPRHNDSVIPRRRLAQIRILRRPQVATVSLPPVIVLADAAAPDAPPVPPNDMLPHAPSIVAEKLASLDVPNLYPAPVLKISASLGWLDWTLSDAVKYCQDYASQTVAQGANRPILVDDGLKQRYFFFYSQCMFRNMQMIRAFGDGGRLPDYRAAAMGDASAIHPAPVAGDWAIAFPPWQAKRSCSFTETANRLAGSCKGPEGSGAAAGVIDGRQVRWSWKYGPDESHPDKELDFIGMVGGDGTISGQVIADQYTPVISGRLGAFTATPGLPPAQLASQ